MSALECCVAKSAIQILGRVALSEWRFERHLAVRP